MKVEFILKEKKFVNTNNQEITYYILERQLVDGSKIEVPIKSDKCRLLLLSLKIENK